jgi:uncharacterized protein
MAIEDGYLVRIFVGESDRDRHHALYESIVLKAREHGLAGATVTRGVMGYGKNMFCTPQRSSGFQKTFLW